MCRRARSLDARQVRPAEGCAFGLRAAGVVGVRVACAHRGIDRWMGGVDERTAGRAGQERTNATLERRRRGPKGGQMGGQTKC